MNTDPKPSTARLLLAFIFSITLFAAIIFLPAGTVDWTAGWIYFGTATTGFLVNIAYVSRVNADLIEHRMRIRSGTRPWDKILMSFFALLFPAIYVVAGFDAVRYEWSTMSPWLWPLGLAIFVPGAALISWSMGINPFFEKGVRIQSERGHHVIDSGPYRFVRHPGYLGFFGWTLSVPLLLGSWWAFFPAVLAVAGIGIRTALEDRTLRQELTGYEAYAGRVRFRLVPGIW